MFMFHSFHTLLHVLSLFLALRYALFYRSWFFAHLRPGHVSAACPFTSADITALTLFIVFIRFCVPARHLLVR